jgi:hypothetical protein
MRLTLRHLFFDGVFAKLGRLVSIVEIGTWVPGYGEMAEVEYAERLGTLVSIVPDWLFAARLLTLLCV